MSEKKPSVYILTGEDEYAIAQVIATLQAHLGDPPIADLNITRLDGSSYDPDQLFTITATAPFLTDRRLVILTNPLAKIPNSEAAREKFRRNLAGVPPSTALVLIEYRQLTKSDESGDPKKTHWLERWALENPEKALFKLYSPPKDHVLVGRIQAMARQARCDIDPEVAYLLVELVDGDMRLAAQEVDKLCAYVNYSRAITVADVEAVTADSNQGNVFDLVDRLGEGNGRAALAELQRLKEYNDYYSLFGLILRQFRLLLQARFILDKGGHAGEIQKTLKLRSFVSKKVYEQARRFTSAELEAIYRRLVEVDLAVKTSQAPEDLALEYFIAAVTTTPEERLIIEQDVIAG